MIKNKTSESDKMELIWENQDISLVPQSSLKYQSYIVKMLMYYSYKLQVTTDFTAS